MKKLLFDIAKSVEYIHINQGGDVTLLSMSDNFEDLKKYSNQQFDENEEPVHEIPTKDVFGYLAEVLPSACQPWLSPKPKVIPSGDEHYLTPNIDNSIIHHKL